MGRGRVSTHASRAGAITGGGSGCWPIVLTTQLWSMAYGTARLSVPIHVLRVLTKNGTQHDQARGRSRGGLSTNIHVLVDGLGNPWRVRRTAGQCHDRPQAAALLDGVLVERVIADRGYAGQGVMNVVLARGAQVGIPPHPRAKQHRNYDRWWYRNRHVVACVFNKLNHVRRVFSRCDTRARRYLGFIHLTRVLIWLR